MDLLFPNLEKKAWKTVNLNEAYMKHKPQLNMHHLQDQYTLLDNISHQKEFYTYGGFGEDRTDLWHGFEPDAKKMIHLGVDLNNLKVGQLVGSISDGVVVDVFVDPNKFNGWGGRVIVKSPFLMVNKNICPEDENVYILYGHLQAEDLPRLGSIVKMGDVIGKIASGDSNGGWFEHLHLQIMLERYVKRFKTYREIDGYDFYSTDILKELLDPMTVLEALQVIVDIMKEK